MPMNPRLLRPRQTIHPEAANWAARVVAGGGRVGASLAAVSVFCRTIDQIGIRSRIYRLNMFCGASDANLVAVRTPLYTGPAATGTQFGASTDTNNSFVQSDYTERGSPGGLKGNGSSKFLDTGLPGTTFSVGDRHCSAYWTENATLTGNRAFLGNTDATSTAAWFDLHSRSPNAGSEAQITQNYSLTHTAANRWQLAQYVGPTAAESYSDGANKKTGSSFPLGSPAVASSNWFVFGVNPSLFSGVRTDARIAFYSIGLSIPEGSIKAYYDAVNAFQTAMGR